jgi:hypothetical protein
MYLKDFSDSREIAPHTMRLSPETAGDQVAAFLSQVAPGGVDIDLDALVGRAATTADTLEPGLTERGLD